MLIKGPGVSEHDHVVADWGCGGCCVCPGLARWRWEGRTVDLHGISSMQCQTLYPNE